MLAWIRNKFGEGRKTRARANRLLIAVLAQARNPAFYKKGQVADTVTGRFDLVVLHAILAMRAMQRKPELVALNQAFLDGLFMTIDDSFREMGVADMRVPKKVREAAEAFYGRLGSYEEALSQGGFAPLEAALLRNIYGDQNPGEAVLHDLAIYVIGSMGKLAITEASVWKAGKPQYAKPVFGGAKARKRK